MMHILDIKKHITHFSEELKYHAVHEENVTVGGKIIGYVPPVSEDHPMYIFLLDDHVGTVYVHVPEQMVLECSEISEGNYVFFEGFTNVISRYIEGELKKEVSVFAYNLKDISTNGDTNE